MARYGASILKAPILKRIGCDLTVTRDGLKFRVGYKNGTSLDEYFASFVSPLDNTHPTISAGPSTVRDLVNVVSSKPIIPKGGDSKTFVQCSISTFPYLETSDGLYAFTVFDKPVIQMISACLNILKTLPGGQRRDSLVRSLINLIPDPTNPPRSSPRVNHEMFTLLTRVKDLGGNFTERQLDKLSEEFDNKFDFRSLIK